MINALIDKAFLLHEDGHLDEAERLYRQVLETDSNNFQALQLLGTLALRRESIPEALLLLEQALAVLKRRGDAAARHASLYNNLGIALRAAGRHAEAAKYFEQGLELDPHLTELHVSLGGVWMAQGRWEAAIACFEEALSLDPALPGCLCDLGTLYARSGRLEDAIVMYRRVLSIIPSHRAARINLSQMLRRTEKYDEAIALLAQLLRETPDSLLMHGQLGIVYTAVNRFDLALDHFGQVLARKPDDAEAVQYIANIQLSLGNVEEADRYYRRSLALKLLITIAATRSPPIFRMLMVFAPGAGNTPFDSLADRAPYETNILNLLPRITYDTDMLRGQTDVIVNLIADVDQGCAMLAPAAKLIDSIGKPVINHPHKILRTDRESIAALLTGIPGCIIPQTRRYAGADLCAPSFASEQSGFSFPFLARPSGTHGGVNFEKIHNEAELCAFASRNPVSDYYLTEYVDYRSVDGFFRKYRFIFVGEDILPYHLAIDDKWKIHHVTTDMENQLWMQQEERSFLENPHAIFGPSQYDSLQTIRKRVDLEYFGIDCALDQKGQLVLFEANACMLVHQHNEKFPYKKESVLRIKKAFDAMLERVVHGQECPASV